MGRVRKWLYMAVISVLSILRVHNCLDKKKDPTSHEQCFIVLLNVSSLASGHCLKPEQTKPPIHHPSLLLRQKA